MRSETSFAGCQQAESVGADVHSSAPSPGRTIRHMAKVTGETNVRNGSKADIRQSALIVAGPASLALFAWS